MRIHNENAMKRRFNWQSALFTPRVLVILIYAGACSFATVTMVAYFHPQAPTKVFHRTLTFDERVSYQRAIEEVTGGIASHRRAVPTPNHLRIQ
jgi:hypothetical protein